MIPLLTALGASALVCSGVAGLRMLTSTGLEEVEARYRAEEPEPKRAGGFGKLLDTLGQAFLPVAVRAYGPTGLRRLDAAIRRAGRPDGVTLTVYVRRQTGLVVLAVLVLLFCLLANIALVGLLIAVLLGGWMRLWLYSEGAKRQKEIDRELPDFLDVLGVTVIAGLGFRQAVERVCEFHEGALAQEMRRTLREMEVGVTRREAFAGLRDRTRSEGVASFVTALLQAEELGVPLAEALESISADARREHAQTVRQKAAQAAPKVSLVVTMTILPGALLLIIASMLIANAEMFGDLF